MKQYSSYRDSGIQWLNEIPAHWKILPGRALFTENKEKNDGGEHQVLSLSYGSIIIKKNVNEGLIPENYSTYQYIRPGYIIIRCTDLQNDKVSLRTSISEYEGIITGAYLGLIPKPICRSKFIHYLLRAWDCSKELYRYGSGLRQSLSWNDFKYLLLPIPSPEEQEAIVAYLDAATAKIDEAIAQQQRMIDLLNERKKIVINHAVTKGFNPNVKYKETGIAWIGVIPEHWQLMQLRYTVSNHDNLRQPITADQRERNNPQYYYYGASGVIDKIDHYNVDDKVLLIGEDGANLVLRNLPLVYKAEGKFWVNNHAHILKPKGNDYDFMALVLEAADYTLFITGSAQPKLSQANMNAVKLPIPPIEEQREIVAGIKPKLEKIDSFIEQHSSMVAFLEERKQIIINDVVTGKVKVV